MTPTNFASTTVWLRILMSFGAGSLSVLWGQPITGILIGSVADGTSMLTPNAKVPITGKDTRCGVRSSADTTGWYTAALPLDTCGVAMTNIAETNPLNP